MSTRAAPNPRPRPSVEPGTRPRTRTRPRPVPRREPRIRMAYVVIPLIALILGGIVLVNVAKLSLTNRTGQVIERSRSIEASVTRPGWISAGASPGRIFAFCMRNAYSPVSSE